MSWRILCANQDTGGSIHALAWEGRHRTANDAEHYFKVQNTDDGQKIYAVGLGESGDSGQLIKKNNAFDAFADKLKNFLETGFTDISKTSGFTNALNELKATLPTNISFITAED